MLLLVGDVAILLHDRLDRVEAVQEIGKTRRAKQYVQVSCRTRGISEPNARIHQLFAIFQLLRRILQFLARHMQLFFGGLDFPLRRLQLFLDELDPVQQRLDVFLGRLFLAGSSLTFFSAFFWLLWNLSMSFLSLLSSWSIFSIEVSACPCMAGIQALYLEASQEQTEFLLHPCASFYTFKYLRTEIVLPHTPSKVPSPMIVPPTVVLTSSTDANWIMSSPMLWLVSWTSCE